MYILTNTISVFYVAVLKLWSLYCKHTYYACSTAKCNKVQELTKWSILSAIANRLQSSKHISQQYAD